VLAILLTLLILVIGGFVVFWDMTRGPLPQLSGQVTAAGLTDTVEIIRDDQGIPQIYASNLHDLYFAQGYTQAQDRWWQMEFFRHTGHGRIQELTGKSDAVMGSDLYIRTAGWSRAAARDLAIYDPEIVRLLEAFAAGVNAYILSRPANDLAIEYSLLGITGVNITIEPWSPVDTLVWAKVMQWDLSGNADNEEFRQTLIDTFGQAMFADYFHSWPFGRFPTIVREEDLPLTSESADAGSAAQPAVTASSSESRILAAGGLPLGTRFILGGGDGIGSNNWVVSGSRTASGRPILANDPHLSIRMPSIWYEIGLHCRPVTDACPMDVRGFTFAPTPAVIIGHNGRIAWGVTNVGPDTQDLYRLQINPENELQYRWNGEWRDMDVREETINFGNGEAPVTIRVRETHLGPVITDNQFDSETGEISGFNNENPMAFRWTALDSTRLLESVFALNQAQNWEAFRDALRLWDSPSQNFVYADVDGNIGYQMPGAIPIRAEGETGLVPSNCAEDACAWQGYIPFEQLPRIFNPERGYIVTANQAVVPLGYYSALAADLGEGPNYLFSQEWDIGYRGARISELIEASTAHTIESMAAIQGDNKLVVAEDYDAALAALTIEDATLAATRDWLLEWDHQLDQTSARAALYMMFVERLMVNLFEDQMALIDVQVAGRPYELFAAAELLNDPQNVWWDDTSTAGTETRDDILLRSLQEAESAAVTRLGDNRDSWRWGSLHTATFISNPLGLSGIDLIEGLVNRSGVETGGGHPAVNATAWNFGRSQWEVRALPSMRMLVDVGAWENSRTIHTTGQSGHPFSRHYDDMIAPWVNIEYHPMRYDRADVEAAAVETLVLAPGG
jgi:penicillin amidase